ncbi:PREDICTED: LOW QUALITY PROTEIN: LEAF RUST 10 DISEASE-RESISTANCE LOCUS RECEPTOR-LIKE PROTEIN KINASE-like 2.8 [Camelina sativa]|uniref:non-specific serine/threonine protein kinase n=1 Tax=Camelina sativa TaxID=90675 RepID=A0ABM1RPJ8_CAMSA|nr:PREDICTED: LOW QUALITY PROTEIN: LEAF RUST 10 DISEASE-RESISTANCE LOCUS RECEPTOR-LIKE PROTEIN KINASE-like 2.8 [Camelina sativa]
MYHPLSTSLILFFLFSLFYQLPCASSNQQGLGWCETLFQCGNITAGFPFWGGNRHKPCGHPLLELHCNNNITSLFISDQEFYALQLTHLESVLRKGFEMKLVIDEVPCQECSSTRGICGFNSTTQICCNGSSPSGGVKCVPYQPSADEMYKRCSGSFNCSNRQELYYPFWIPGRENCGHPDFKLDCSRGFAEFNIASIKLRILSREYYSTIRIAKSDYIGDLCPSNPINVPIINIILPFFQLAAAETELLTLYYNCQFHSSALSSTIYGGELGCDGGRSYYVTRNLSSTLLYGFRGLFNNFKVMLMCKRNVSIPVSGSALETLQRRPTLDNLRMALEQGVELNVNLDCLMCIQSSGACGYNQTSSSFVCYCLLTGVVTIFLVLLCPFFRVQIFRKRKTSYDLRLQKMKALIPLKHYTYAEVKKITKSFAEEVGRGGFGIVYSGTLSDGRMVAVKVLKESKGSKRAVMYEFLGNGSLDKFISDKNSTNLDLSALYGIALGVARGLEYLHYACKTRIVHIDIKPQNVLLDDNLCPKVSDFGLAKLCEKKESILSFLETRGTVGYIAPEMISRLYGSVSHKSDVYSYRMLVLEMIGARKKERFDQNSASETSSMYFPEWIYKDLEKADTGGLIENGIKSEEEEIAKKMTIVGLWCIQSSPSNCPPMNRVVEMMEGSLEPLEVPPRPVLQRIPAALLSESFRISEENSSSSEILLCSTNSEPESSSL